MKFTGEFAVRRRREEVYAFFTNPTHFAPLLPEYESMTQEDESHFTVRVKVGISYIRGTAEAKLHLSEADQPNRALYKGQATVPGGSADVTASFDLREASEGTQVNWMGEAQIFGKLRSMAGGLLEPLAKKNVEKLIRGLQQALEGGAAPASQPAAAEPAGQSSQQIDTGVPAPKPPASEQASQKPPSDATGGVSAEKLAREI